MVKKLTKHSYDSSYRHDRVRPLHNQCHRVELRESSAGVDDVKENMARSSLIAFFSKKAT